MVSFPRLAGVEVIVPARNMATLLTDCLTPIIEQLDGRVTVVDDASTDHTADVAEELGAHVIRLDRRRGPYHARHIAAVQSKSCMLLFIDGRSRALPGLVDAHKTLLSQAAFSCTETLTRTGRSLAERFAAKHQPFALNHYIGVPGRMDYYPTCNLGVRASVYRAVGGFRQMRSGGDADLCWRIQQAGLGRIGVDRRVLMEWQPRSSLWDLIEQYDRYGKSAAYLEAVWPDQIPLTIGGRIDWRSILFKRHGTDAVAAAVAIVAQRAGLWRGRRKPFNSPCYFA